MKPATFPPGPKGQFYIGNLRDLRNRPIEFMEECVAEFGDVSHFQIANIPVYLLNHPDLVEEVLVTSNRKFIKPQLLRDTAEVFGRGLLVSDGDFWLRQRRLAAPAFHRQRIASYGTVMTDFTERMLDRWRDDETLDVHAEMMRTTLEIVTKALFGAEVTAQDTAKVGEALEIMLERFVDRISLLRFLQQLPLPKNLRFRNALATLDSIIYRIIEARRRDGVTGDDLLSMLLAAQDDDGSSMSDRQVRDETVTLFLAGHETTAVSLTWTFLLLSNNPDVEVRLGEELDRVLGGRVPTLDDLPALEYTGRVVKESMRLYPPAWRVGREAIEECEVGGYPIPAGAQLIMSQWTLQRDARYFDDPLEFRPDRWTAEFERALPKYAYFPFGGGPRRCIGDQFAMMEATLILATIARKYRLEVLPNHPIEYWPSITLRPRHGLRAVVRRRTQGV
jgi:cytochrome P450